MEFGNQNVNPLRVGSDRGCEFVTHFGGSVFLQMHLVNLFEGFSL